MTTGLFNTRAASAQGIGARAHQRKQRRAAIDAFADRLAEHGDVKLAASETGISASYGRVLMARIKARLGAQAV